MCWKLYFKILLLPLSLIDTAKLAKKSDIYKHFNHFNTNLTHLLKIVKHINLFHKIFAHFK